MFTLRKYLHIGVPTLDILDKIRSYKFYQLKSEKKLK